MILLTSIAIGVLFGAGMYAMAHRDLVRLAGGTLLIGNSAILFLMSATFQGSEAPILPVDAPEKVADPLVQALALTAIVISFATTVLLLRVALTVEGDARDRHHGRHRRGRGGRRGAGGARSPRADVPLGSRGP